MNVLLGCEKSGVVRQAFAKRGHNAWSCDLKASDTPGNHYQCDLFEALTFQHWDLLILFPPCTHLAVSGASHFEKKRLDGRQKNAIAFFMRCVEAVNQVGRGCIENPVGIMSTIYRKPDQIIQPFYFGGSYQKTTCLWLKGLPKLFHAKSTDLFNDTITHVDRGPIKIWKSGGKMAAWFSDAKSKGAEMAAEIRAKTFPGIAAAMATQWG